MRAISGHFLSHILPHRHIHTLKHFHTGAIENGGPCVRAYVPIVLAGGESEDSRSGADHASFFHDGQKVRGFRRPIGSNLKSKV